MMEDGDRSIAALLSSSTGGRALKGVVAFVDVKTDDGACAGDLWSEMLRSLGAKVSFWVQARGVKLISGQCPTHFCRNSHHLQIRPTDYAGMVPPPRSGRETIYSRCGMVIEE
jgi:hypothetical protein